jgi:hypothetical protein
MRRSNVVDLWRVLGLSFVWTALLLWVGLMVSGIGALGHLAGWW